MDSSVAIGAALYALGVLCVVTLALWAASDRRKEEARAAEEAEAAGEAVEPPARKRGLWDRLDVHDRPF